MITGANLEHIFSFLMLCIQGIHLYVLSQVVRRSSLYHSDLKSHLNRIEKHLNDSSREYQHNPNLESSSDVSSDEGSPDSTDNPNLESSSDVSSDEGSQVYIEEIDTHLLTNTHQSSCRKRRRSNLPL